MSSCHERSTATSRRQQRRDVYWKKIVVSLVQLPDFYVGAPGAAFQAQLLFTRSRSRQQTTLGGATVSQITSLATDLFEREQARTPAEVDDNELVVVQIQRRRTTLAGSPVAADLVSYLQAPTDVCVAGSASRERANPELAPLDDDYVARAERGLQPLLLPLQRRRRCSSSKPRRSTCREREVALADLERQLRGMGKGTRSTCRGA